MSNSDNEETVNLNSKESLTRKKILDSAIKIFSKKGYHETRVDEIVKESKTSKGAVYFHFPSKQRLFLALVDEFVGLLENKLKGAISQEQSGVLSVDAALRSGLETFGKYRGLAKIFLVQAVGLGSIFEEKRLEILQRFSLVIKSYLDQAIEKGDIPEIDTEIAASAWIGAINEVVIRWVYQGGGDTDRIILTLRTMLLRSIGVPSKRIEKLDGIHQQ